MGLFEDLSRFLESRLDEFLKANPHLELMALEEQLRGQEEDAINLLGNLKHREQQLEDSILSTAQEIQRWHERIKKAKAANRQELVTAAQEREAALLREGNHLWGQMQGIKQQLEKTRQLQRQIHDKRRELKAKIAAAEAAQAANRAHPDGDGDRSTTGWNRSPYQRFSQPVDPLEETFQRWETEEELEELKRQMRR